MPTDLEGLWQANIALDINNPEPGDPDIDAGEDLPDSARSQRLYEAIINLSEQAGTARPPYPTQIVRSDDGYTEVAFLVQAGDRLAALDDAGRVCRAAVEEAEIDPGPLRLTVSGPGEPHEPGELDEEAADDSRGPPLEPDDRYARGWYVEHPLARGALRKSALDLLDEIDDAITEAAAGEAAGNTLFAVGHLPDGFAAAYDLLFLERFRVCLVVVGYKLAQDPPTVPGCIAEELALEVIRSYAQELIEEENPNPEAVAALRGVFEVPQDDDVLNLFRMEEPSDAAVAGHDPVSRMMGMADMRVEHWFDPAWGGRAGATPHPICWDEGTESDSGGRA